MSPSTRIIVPLLLPLVWALSPMVHADPSSTDQPDLRRERRFFNVYSKFNQEPTSEDNWSGALKGKAQGYTVQKGDTLWAVSETLFGDPQFWPKIWSLNNEDIENPHEILPEQEVKFVPGTMGEAPSLAVTEGGEGQEASATEKPEVPADPIAGIQLPDPGKKHPPLIGIPGSLPNWEYRKDRRQEIQMEVQKISREFVPTDEVLTYFLADDETQGTGKVSETEMNLSSATEFQYVFVKFPGAPSGKQLLVVKDMGQVKDPVSGEKGTVVQVQGELEVLETVNSKEFLYRALVKKVLSPIEVGAKLIPGDLPMYSSREEGAGGASNARIIGGQYGVKRYIFGPSNLVFLSGQGLTAGQTYPIYKVQLNRNEDTDGIQNHREIGKVKIVKLTKNFATGVVLQASEDIRVGDVTSPQGKAE